MVVVPPVDEYKPRKKSELGDTKVSYPRSLLAFLARYPNSNTGGQDHGNIIGTVPDGQGQRLPGAAEERHDLLDSRWLGLRRRAIAN